MPPFDGTSATASFLSFSLHQLGGGGRHNNHHSDDASVTSHNSRSSAHTTKPELEDNTDDPRAEKALRSVQGALTAIVDVFEHEGVASASIQELRDGIENGRFINVLERAKDYASYITPSSSQSKKSSDENNSICQTVMMACLLHAAWDACMRYYQMQYQTAYRRFHKLRRKHHHQQHKQERHPELAVPMIPVEVVDRALEIQVQRAEQVCTCQREVILAGALEKRLTRASQATATTTTSRTSAVAATAST